MKVLTDTLLDQLTTDAKNSPRLRTHYNLHESVDEPIHRLAIAIEPGSYIRPHRHLHGNKFELFMLLRGSGDVLVFDDFGNITDRHKMGGQEAVKAVELSANEWHCFIARETGTVALEVKPGPYFKPPEEDFAQWAPKEGEPKTAEFLQLRLND